MAELSSNEETSKYRMFPNAYKFIKLLHDQVARKAEGVTAAEALRLATLTHDEVPKDKAKPWAYYISETLRAAAGKL